MKKPIILLSAFMGSIAAMNSSAQITHSKNQLDNQKTMNNKTVTFKTVKIDGLDIFYREAGDKTKPTILLLHGFPSSSHMFRDLINDLSDSFHLVAPDYPDFGQSSAPSAKDYQYSFANLTAVLEDFIEALELKTLSLYVQDYGGPIGIMIEAKRPYAIYLSSKSIKEIAWELGYEDEYYFSRFFKVNAEVSPQRYRDTIGFGREVLLID